VHAEVNERVEIYLWEDEADVRYDGTHRRFRLATRPGPGGWIPDALALVEQLLAGLVAVDTESVAGRTVRRTVVLDHAPDGKDAIRRTASDLVARWIGPCFL
jgi:hypothetical protein